MTTAGMFWDSLGRPITSCCGALILSTRRYQCIHEWRRR